MRLVFHRSTSPFGPWLPLGDHINLSPPRSGSVLCPLSSARLNSPDSDSDRGGEMILHLYHRQDCSSVEMNSPDSDSDIPL
jgi:hypothetical protein